MHSNDTIIEPSSYLAEVAHSATLKAIDLKLNYDGRFEDKDHTKGTDDLLKSCYSVNTLPGGNYRLLAALADSINARKIIEIGTFWGVGTLALREEMNRENRD